MIEILISAMGLRDVNIVDTANIHSNCLIINQCDKDDEYEVEKPYGIVRMISSKERGLSKSRNMALQYAKADICVLCDDDVVYFDGYEVTIEKAFSELPDADVIVFNINSKTPVSRPQETYFNKVKRIPWYKMYSSVHIAFRRERILKAGLAFDERFGAGSGMYSMAEDSIFFRNIHKKNLKAYVYPAVIADLYSEKSTWFHGYDERYFYDIGAFLATSFPFMKTIFSFYYAIHLREKTSLSLMNSLKWIWRGCEGIHLGISYEEYCERIIV